MWRGALVSLVAALCGGGCGGAKGSPIPLGVAQSGIATYYTATGAGACSFDPTPNDLDVAAMNSAQYGGSAVCGECAAVNGPKGAVTVRIVDLCPECGTGHLDLSEQAFAKIANVADGRVPITWQAVACQVQGPIAYHYQDGSSQWWTSLQVRNHRLPISKLELRMGGAFFEVPRADYNYFVQAQGAGPGPLTVRITAIDGQTLTDTLPAAAPDVTVTGGGQFR
jgi:expansin (peptidoglycan-binding protein)